MRTHERRFALILVFVVLVAGPYHAEGESDPGNERRTTGRVGMAIGFKEMGSSWEALDDQTSVLLSLTVGKESWPVHLAFDYVRARNTNSRVTGFPLIPPFCCFTTAIVAESDTTEWDLGVRKGWREGKSFRPYVGGGLAVIRGKLVVVGAAINASETAPGYWIDFGFRAPAGRRLEWGIDARHSSAEVNLGDGDIDAGGEQLLLYSGVRW